ncbi:MAG: hypothetical protein AAGA35_03160 [Patescibacteria group bacterium]
MKKLPLILLLVIVVMGVLFLVTKEDRSDEQADERVSVLAEYTVVREYGTDTVLTEPLTIQSGEAITVANDVLLQADSDVVIDGALGCSGGSLTLVANGRLTINDIVACEDTDEGDGNVTIVAQGGLIMGSDAQIVADGDVQIVDGESAVRSEDELEALYNEVAVVPESGFAIGPFLDEGDSEEEVGAEEDVPVESVFDWDTFRLIDTAHAQVDNGTTTVNLTGEPIRVSGKIKINTPAWKGAKRIVVFDFPNTPEVTIEDFELEGPKGRDGDGDAGACDVEGADGEDAFRFNAQAPNLIVNNFTLTLGNGGDGGEAVTGDGCEDAKAVGGDGGKSGNFRMIGSQNFEIRGAFMIHPGNGGAGGGAEAKGKDGEADEKGGNANATGGKGAHIKKKLSVSGVVAGTSNVQFGDAVGGLGGQALAEGGKGGDASECGMEGAPGGNATAKSGRGGDADLTITGGAGRMEFAADIGGAGGLVQAYGGVGGAGGSCDETKKGGNGGVGGNAKATEGKGGLGDSGHAPDGGVLGDDGGDGGVGGDGCTEGIGGAGGSGGIEDGEKGEDGKNICLTITKEEDYISLLPGEIQVIRHKDYLIPITNLSRVTGNECDGDEHWHPGPNGAINLRGMAVPDPNPTGCGFGKTNEVEIEIVMDPNYVAPTNEQSANSEDGGMVQVEMPPFGAPASQPPIGGSQAEEGEWVQVEPPRLIIPAQ